MAVARVTLSKAVLSFEGGAATIVVELLEKKTRESCQNGGEIMTRILFLSICTLSVVATLMIYRLSFSHTLLPYGSRGELVMKSMIEEKNACVKQI